MFEVGRCSACPGRWKTVRDWIGWLAESLAQNVIVGRRKPSTESLILRKQRARLGNFSFLLVPAHSIAAWDSLLLLARSTVDSVNKSGGRSVISA
jgi:hypothetical protein